MGTVLDGGHSPPPQTRRVLFASAEAYPFDKVGGLAGVSSALPKRLANLGFDVRLVIPGYRGLGGSKVLAFEVPFGPVAERVVVRRLPPQGGVDVFTLDLPGWFDREVPYSYQDDDVMPFVLFSKAVTTLAAQDSWRPHLIHCNDWHCGLVAQDARQGPHRLALERTGIVFTIHNIAYKGWVGAATDQLTRNSTPSGIRGSTPAMTAPSSPERPRTRRPCSGSASWSAPRSVRSSAWWPGWCRRRGSDCCPRHWTR